MNASQVWAAIRDGFARLLQFSGRTSRGPFWAYAIAVVLGLQALGAIGMMGFMMRMFAAVANYAEMHPEDVQRTVSPLGVSVWVQISHPLPGMGAAMTSFIWLVAGLR